VRDVRILTQIPITYDVAGGGTTHAPLLLTRIAGVETRIVLDTGSDVHLLTKELVDELGLAVETGEEGTDHAGATIPSWAVEDVPLSLGALEVTLRDVVAIPAPPPFQGAGIGAALSPQHLHPSAWAVVDLAGDELALVEADETELATWLEKRAPGLAMLTLARDRASAAVVIEAAIDPYPAIPTLLDTGGRRTEFAAEALPGLAVGEEERLGAGVGGTAVMGASAGEATLLAGGHRIPVDSLAVRSSMHDPKGLIGMDVLRGTVVAAAADVGRPVLWGFPAERS
jgi:hypothetical protein